MQAPESLRQLQQAFAAAVWEGEDTGITAQVLPQGALQAKQRAGIYRHSVHGHLYSYLQSVYPVCEALLGERYFKQVVYALFKASPPKTPFLADYGAELIAFLQQRPELQAQTYAWMIDVAHLEWARHSAWHAVNQPPGDFAALAQLDETQQSRARFELPHSACLLASPYAIAAIWAAHQAHYQGEPLEQLPLQQPTYLMVWRQERYLMQVALSAVQYEFLQAVQAGQCLEALTQSFAAELPALLQTAVQQAWIITFKA